MISNQLFCFQERSKCQEVNTQHLVDSYSTKSLADDVIVNGHTKSNFTTVKVNKFKRKVKCDQTKIDTYNKFEMLNDEECRFHMITEDELKFKSDMLKIFPEKICERSSQSVTKTRKKKMKVTSLKEFETHNRFGVLENNSEEQLDGMIKRLKIIKMKKVL